MRSLIFSAIVFMGVWLALIRPGIIFKKFEPHLQRSYEAFAHIIVGLLIGGAAYGGPSYLWITAMLMSVVEVVCAIITVVRQRRGL